MDEDEVMLSLHVNSLFTNVPVEESIQLAADLLYSSTEVSSFDRETFVELMRLTVTDVHFNCVGQWYVQQGSRFFPDVRSRLRETSFGSFVRQGCQKILTFLNLDLDCPTVTLILTISGRQFKLEKGTGRGKDILLKTEDSFDLRLAELEKKGKTDSEFLRLVRSYGAQPALLWPCENP